MVLLKNEGVLPLNPDAKLAVIGPHVDSTQDLLSNYHGLNKLVNDHTVLLGLQAHDAQIVGHAYGCIDSKGKASLDCTSQSGFDEATALAAEADVALVFVGLAPGGNMAAQEEETWDRVNLTLPGEQEALIESVCASNPNCVVVLIHGGPLTMTSGREAAAAILDAHYPGELGGDAVASVLFGDVSPAGRLTTTVYPADFVSRNMTDLDLTSGEGITYKHYQGVPVFPFGHGLSYTSFELEAPSPISVSASALAAACPSYGGSSPVSSTVNVRNTGSRSSDFVLLAFLVKPEEDTLKELVGFERVHVQAGATAAVTVGLAPQVLARVDDHGAMTFKPGSYMLEFGVDGGSEGNAVQTSLQLQGEAITVFNLTSVLDGDSSNFVI